jgi:predicted nucleic acid-binding protein
MLFAYWLDGNPEHGVRIKELRTRMRERGDRLVTSIFTLGELLTAAYKHNKPELASQFRELLQPPNVELLPFTAETADRYARIRAANRVAPVDAIHLACASHAGVDLFLTNDRSLCGLVVQGIDFVAGLDVNIL